MTEIPEHLLKRAQEAREKANSGESAQREHIPMHLREAYARARWGANIEGVFTDPFDAKKAQAEATKQRLAVAKVALVKSVLPLRERLDTAQPAIMGQILPSKALRFGASFRPHLSPSDDYCLTLYSGLEAFTQVSPERAVRLGQVFAWRMPFATRELGMVLKQTGQRPLRDSVKLSRGDCLFVDAQDITKPIVERVLETAAAERTTNSAVLFEGDANKPAYDESYGARYGAAVSIVKNPADTFETEGIFGVDIVSLTGNKIVNEQSADDGAMRDIERIAVDFSFGRNRQPSSDEFARLFTDTSVVFGAFTDFLNNPSSGFQSALHRSIDAAQR